MSVYPKDQDGPMLTMLHLSVGKGDEMGFPDVVSLLHMGADPNAPELLMGASVLSWAVRDGAIRCAKALLGAGADPHSKDKYGRSSLWIAAQAGHFECVKLLLDAGADPDVADQWGVDPARTAEAAGHAACASLLRAASAHPALPAMSVDAEKDLSKSSQALLRAASKAPHPDHGGEDALLARISAALDAGADIGAKDRLGREPLAIAASNGYERRVELLLKRGANPDARDAMGSTALVQAAKSGSEAAAIMLIGAGADVDAKAFGGDPASHWAAKHGLVGLVSELGRAGADFGQRNFAGCEAADVAHMNGQLAAANLVRSAKSRAAAIKLRR